MVILRPKSLLCIFFVHFATENVGRATGASREREGNEIEEGLLALTFAINWPNNAKRFLKRKMLLTKTELAI